ncbi:hypothetical protein B0H15DRAFT_946847 [Mycena belliarum]|uniref:F-box domain-containing protein n=1 Tax=Mycena belliarum TaxID=1033014 RepID=A0AAD6U7R0_9AGAR|nr:hypothetical protein B0H15DRAFT_946847 [Mycena belliae]
MPHAISVTFWSSDDVVLYVIRYLSLIDMVKMCATTRRMHALGKAVLKGRVARYTTPFFDRGRGYRYETQEDLDRFFSILRRTRSWIVGSVALSVASILSDPPARTNINLLSPYGQLQEWTEFLVDLCGFAIVSEGRCDGAHVSEGGQYLVFRHDDRKALHVTVTTSSRPHILQLFFAAPNTVQQVALGAHHLITPFPVMTSNQEGLRGRRPTDGAHPAVLVHDHDSYKNQIGSAPAERLALPCTAQLGGCAALGATVGVAWMESTLTATPT